MSEDDPGFSQDWYFDPAGASEVGGTADRLGDLKLTGNFAADAKSFLMAIGQGSKALDRGDLATVRTELEDLLAGRVTVAPLQNDPREKDLAEADQTAIKTKVEEVLKGQ